MLLEDLLSTGVSPSSLLDIGGGVGALQHELFKRGLERAVHVDAARAYLDISREEAEQRGTAERVRYVHGDFVDLADDIEPASIVTLDRVVCCYHDAEAMLDRAAERADALCGLVYPRNAWWTRAIGTGINVVSRLRRSPFRFFVHATHELDAVVRARGLIRRSRRTTFIWQVVVYERSSPGAAT
ncbi:MAG: methyltransferase domain-containing protein [Rhodothermales bacterium]|nr:methyltransferase domain-containing protein [Rhodothermales bacterium]